MVNVVAIADRAIGPGNPCFIIAEAGVNHGGDLETALSLVDAAAEAGADAVKFQSFHTESLVSPDAPKVDYQLESTGTGEGQFEMLQALELTKDMHQFLQRRCSDRGILFLSTPFDKISVDLLSELDVKAFKLGSGEITNWPLLDYVAGKGRPVILSTGMSYIHEVEDALHVIRKAGNDRIILLHCVSDYPADPRDINLRAILTLSEAFQLPVGYSDHTLGLEVALAAVALGASVVEKHLTLDRAMPGPDHRASLEPRELRELVAGIRIVELALGSGEKRPAKSEVKNRSVVRRSISAAMKIETGSVIKSEMLSALRPASGISPCQLTQVLGRRVKRNLSKGELLSWSDLE